MEYEQIISAYVCHYCKGSFDHLENLQKHVQQIHTARSSSKDKICPLCGLWCVKYDTYRDHLKHIHRQNEDGKAFALKCFPDFLVWKNELEKRNYCKYIMQGNPKTLQSSKDKLHVYRCDSSTPTTKERRSTCITKDSCPSMISAIESCKNHSVKVEYWNTHIGHAIPVQGAELDAAIDSLQNTEIVIEDSQYQTLEQDSEGNLYFLSESNDGSYSEPFVKEVTTKKHTPLFKNNSISSPNTAPRKFSFKKDPTKKSVSFSGSLASVACMKASVKKDPPVTTVPVSTAPVSTAPVSTAPVSTAPVTTAPVTTAPVTTAETPVTPSTSSVTATSTLSSESETLEPSVEDSSAKDKPSAVPKVVKSPKTGVKKNSFRVYKPIPTPLSASKFPSIAPIISTSPIKIDNVRSMPNLNITGNDKLNGQFVVLNSLEGQNGQQNLILCPVGSDYPPMTQPGMIGTPAVGVPAVLQNSNLNIAKPTENTTQPVKNVVTQLAQNVKCPSVKAKSFLSYASSILKKQGITEKSPELNKTHSTPNQKGKRKATGELSLGKKLSLLKNMPSSPNASNNKGVVTVNPTAIGSNSKNSSAAAVPVPSNLAMPGMTYIQINDNLYPISASTGQIAGSNFISSYNLGSPMPPAQNSQSPILNLSSLTQLGQLSNVMPSSKSGSVKTTSIGARSASSTETLPVIMFSQLGDKLVSTSVSDVSLSKCATLNSTNFITSTPKSSRSKLTSVLSNLASPNSSLLRPSFLSNTTQFISSPLQPIRTYSRLPLAQASPALGLSSFGVGSIPAATASKTLPLSNNADVKTTLSFGCVSTPVKTDSTVLNTEPISSAPTFNITSKPIAHPQKPGAFIFESSGDLYVLEPINDNTKLQADLSAAKHNETNISSKSDKIKKPRSKRIQDADLITLDESSDSERETGSLSNVNVLEKESISPTKEAKKLKKTKRCPTVAKGKQIETIAQKRPSAEDDSEISKKVKYYNLEMMYLSSQAECKRLKLELAKVHMMNRENMLIGGNSPSKDQNFSKSAELEVKQNTAVESTDTPQEDSDEMVIDPLPCTIEQTPETTKETETDVVNNNVETTDAKPETSEVEERSIPVENVVSMDYEVDSSEVDSNSAVVSSEQNECHDSERVKFADEDSTNSNKIQECSEIVDDQEKNISISSKECSETGDYQVTKSSEDQPPSVCEKDEEIKVKELEIQHGDKSSDVYTMIRTSVLRNLYAEVNEISQANEKLSEELQLLNIYRQTFGDITVEFVNEESQIEDSMNEEIQFQDTVDGETQFQELVDEESQEQGMIVEEFEDQEWNNEESQD